MNAERWRPDWRRVKAFAARLLVFLAIAVALQWYCGAYRAETAGQSDESAHIVTGLMVRDYVLHGPWAQPMAFARDYYLHYPRVALGHWPPIFYIEQALWTLVFPTSRGSLLLLMALMSAGLATLLFPLVRERHGTLAAWCVCLLMSMLPGMTRWSGQVMAEVPQALLVLAAMLAWARFLDSGRWQSAFAFGLWSSAAMLMKGTALVLVALPVFGVLFTGRWRLLGRWSFWLPAAVVVALCAPWYLTAPDALHERVAPLGGPVIATWRFHLNTLPWERQFGWVCAVAILLGIVTVVWRRVRGRHIESGLACAAALAIAGTAGPYLFRVWESRHQIEAAPAFALVAAAGAGAVGRRLLGENDRVQAAALIVVTLIAGAWNLRKVTPQKPLGHRALAAAIVEGKLGSVRAVVACGDPVSEGALVSEVAQLESHPRRYVLRGSKLFVEADFLGLQSRQRFTRATLASFLSGLPVDLMVLDRRSQQQSRYQHMLKQALEADGERWRAVESPAGDGRFALFVRTSGSGLTEDETRRKLREVMDGKF